MFIEETIEILRNDLDGGSLVGAANTMFLLVGSSPTSSTSSAPTSLIFFISLCYTCMDT